MTGRKMQEEIERVVNALDIPKNKIFSSDVFAFLNDQQTKYIEETFSKKFEKQQDKWDRIRTIIVKDCDITPTQYTGYAEGSLPSDYRYLVNDRSTGVYCDEAYNSPNRLIDDEVLHNVLDFSYSTTDHESPVSSLNGSKIRVYFNPEFTVETITIDYVRAWLDISTSQNCELPISTHADIVRMAINAIIEKYAPERLQSKLLQDASARVSPTT